MAKTLSITSKYNKNMIPCIIFGEYGWNFIFVDTKNNQCVKDEAVTMAWLKRNGITICEFTRNCWNEYECMKEHGVKFGLISYFTKDDSIVYNYAKTLNLEESYTEAFNN